MEWWQTNYDESYLHAYGRNDLDARADGEVARWSSLFPAPPARLLDVACGHGRHALRFAQRGYDVTGLDYSASLLSIARLEAEEQQISAQFVHGDMRAMRFENEFDLVTNLFTAFGYFNDEMDDLRTLQSMLRALKPGGMLVQEITHRDAAMRAFRERDWYETSEKTVVRRDRSFDALRGLSEETQYWVDTDGLSHERRHQLRVFSATELALMLRRAGFADIQAYDSDTLRPFSFKSRRLLLTARKPEA